MILTFYLLPDPSLRPDLVTLSPSLACYNQSQFSNADPVFLQPLLLKNILLPAYEISITHLQTHNKIICAIPIRSITNSHDIGAVPPPHSLQPQESQPLSTSKCLQTKSNPRPTRQCRISLHIACGARNLIHPELRLCWLLAGMFSAPPSDLTYD